jgi:class 3 adenylate cyclase
MVFVNEIAEIVHGVADSFHGAANKNIGDAFLMVWKIPEDLMYVNNENQLIVIDQPEVVNQIADMSLLAFVKIILEVKKSPKIEKYNKHKGLQQRLPNYSVKMGFGLHIGWAIEVQLNFI